MIWLESLLDSLSVSGVCYSDAALSQTKRENWLQVLKNHDIGGRFKSASIGRAASLQSNFSIRNDKISWLEGRRPEDQEILNELNQWRTYLNQSLFLSTRTTEAHFAQYEAGHFYKRHLDQHETKNSRILSFVIYLHKAWSKADGGELVITNGDTNQIKQIIEPLPGRVVVFKSDEIWHEVQTSHFTRLSLTGWFRYDAEADL